MLTLLTNMPRDVLIRQLQDGLVLLVLGMGFVFIFLAILVFATKGMSRVCSRFAPATEPKKKAPATTASAASRPAVQSSTAKDAEIAAAIAAAYSKSRN